MSSTQVRGADFKLEIVIIPVSDFDRAKRFYSNLGWRLDAEFAKGDEYRVIQFTPPGSGCSIIFGKNVTAATPGSTQGLYLIVSNIEPARDELLGRGVKVSEVFHGAGDVYTGPDEPYLFGAGPGQWTGYRTSHLSLVRLLQRSGRQRLAVAGSHRAVARTRRCGRHNIHLVKTELASALRRAEAAHGEYEKRIGKRDADWPSWYAEYMIRERAGKPLPS